MSGKNYEMKFEFKPCSLTLSSVTPDLGDASEEIGIEYRADIDGDKPFAIGLNGRYFQDMLEVLEGEKVNIGMFNELAPIKVEEDDSIHILMPLRLSKPEPKSESETQPETEHETESDFVEEVEVD